MIKALPVIALLWLAACRQEATFDHSEAATSPAANEAARTIGRHDGRAAGAAPPMTPADAGARMRSAARERPHPQ